jgi:hypothetical protein
MLKINIWLTKPSNLKTWLALALVYVCFFIVWIFLSSKLYNGPLGSFPNRLDVTLDLWLRRPISEHWFMFFLNRNDIEAGIPYSNIPYFYSFFYVSYHSIISAITFGRWPYATTYLMTMFALLVSSWYLLRPVIAEFSLARCFLVLALASGMLVTSPYVTGYLLQFNHDNAFPFNAIAATVLAFAIWRDEGRLTPVVWVSLIYCSISGLLGLVTLGCCFVARNKLNLTRVSWCFLFAVNIVGLLLPMFVAQLFFDQTSASGLLFRTGLDGATDYFTSHWQAFANPIQHRSIERMLGLKLFVLGTLMAIGWWRFQLKFVNETAALGVALLVYASHWIVFPQSISIHPYLYDILFLVPIDIFTVIVMAGVVGRLRDVTGDIVAMLVLAAFVLLFHSNFLQLAQGRFIGG